MYYIVSLSGGAGSAVAADRAIQRYGRKRVILRFADVSWEDEDLYRFLDDCMGRWGGRLYIHKDGRTPLEVFENKKIIPNNMRAPCTYELKIKPLTEWLWRLPKPVTVLTGHDWHEPNRIEAIRHWHKPRGKKTWRAPQGYARRIHGVYEDFPLLWKPLEFRPYQDVIRSWGISPPRMYDYGFPHNNCGGRCVKQGIREWQRLKAAFPDRFDAMATWETLQQEQSASRENRTLLTRRIKGQSIPLPLRDLEPLNDLTPSQDDLFSCHCTEY